MKKRLLSAAVSISLIASVITVPIVNVHAAAKTPQYQSSARRMEKLNRGLIAVKTTASTENGSKDGVYLSWRLLGDEDLTNQAFDIYRNNQLIHTTAADGATNYIDEKGTANDTYKVLKAGSDTALLATENAVFAVCKLPDGKR